MVRGGGVGGGGGGGDCHNTLVKADSGSHPS